MFTDPLNCGGCNNGCARDEVCTDRNCERFAVGRGCTTCPCPECGVGECCLYPGTTDVEICLPSGVPSP